MGFVVLAKGAPSRRAPHKKEPRTFPRHSEAVRPKNPYSRLFSLQLRKRTGDADSSPSAQNDKEGALRMTKGNAAPGRAAKGRPYPILAAHS